MKKTGLLIVLIFLWACSSSKKILVKPVFEVLTMQDNGGANINFFEIISEPSEIAMLMGDENLKNKIKKEDIQTSSFVLLNLGEKNSGGYTIGVDRVEETPENIIIYTKENKPNEMVTTVMSYPYSVIKINSKKEILIK